MNINKNLNLSLLREKFAKDKIIEINDFLEEEDAELIRRFLFTDMPEDWWHTSILINRGQNLKAGHFRRFPENRKEIEEKSLLAADSFASGTFSYVFDRTIDNHFEQCPCVECNFRAFLNTEPLLTTLSTVSAYEITKPNEIFSSRYTSGHFLSPHHDKSKGKIGFVYNLSKNWLPEHGANLHFMEDDHLTVKKVIVPKFNNFILFDIPSYNGIPHFVSHVAPRINNKRISIAGWFD